MYASGRYPSEFNKTTVAFPLTSGRNGNVLVYDLRYNLDELLKNDSMTSFYPVVKELCFNKCPAVAPISVLENGGWEKIGLDKTIVERNLKTLLAHPEFAEKMREEAENRPDFPVALEPEAALYDGFLDDTDRAKVEAVRNADVNKLADFHPDFGDERLPELLLHYKGRNFPQTLSESENERWQAYRKTRLERIAPNFLAELELAYEKDEFVAEELKLYFESLFESEYQQ